MKEWILQSYGHAELVQATRRDAVTSGKDSSVPGPAVEKVDGAVLETKELTYAYAPSTQKQILNDSMIPR